jgi:hypothetical protein
MPSTTPSTTLSTTPSITSPTSSTQGPTLPSTRPTHAGDAVYAVYDNTSAGWWFVIRPSSTKISLHDSDATAALLETHRAIWRQNTDEKVLYLTMDEGYEYNENTTQIRISPLPKGFRSIFSSRVTTSPALQTPGRMDLNWCCGCAQRGILSAVTPGAIRIRQN